MNSRIAFFVATALLAWCCQAEPKGVFSRPRNIARDLPVVYADVCRSFYSNGCYARLLCAKLDTREDGTPNIVLDRDRGTAEFTVRLLVAVEEYAKWKEGAQSKMDALGLSSSDDMSSFESSRQIRVAGKYYCLGDNENAAMKRHSESFMRSPSGRVRVKVRLVDSNGKDMRKVVIPLSDFARQGFLSYPLPLNHLNRLRDLPVNRFKWYNLDRDDPEQDGKLEDAYAKFKLDGFTDEELSKIVDMRCIVVQE